MIENKSNGVRIEANIDRINNGAASWNAEQGFIKRRNIRCQHRDGIVQTDPALL